MPYGPLRWTLVIATAFLSLSLAAREGMYPERRAFWAWCAFLVWAAFTSAIALDPLAAWLGSPDRRTGFVALLAMAAAFHAGQGVIGHGMRTVARAVVVALLALGAYAIAEGSGWRPIPGLEVTDRAGGPFGSPAYLAAVAVMLVPPAAGLAFDGAELQAWRWTAGTATAAGVVALALSGTKAGLIGLAVAVIISVRVWGRGAIAHLLRFLGVTVSLVLLLALTPIGARVAAVGDLEAEAVGRLHEWRVGLMAMAERPLAGTGLEGYRLAFPQVVDAEYVRTYGREVVTDRAHSGPLDAGVALGLPGLLAWLAAVGYLGQRAWRGMSKGPLLAGLGAGVVGYFAQQLFLFPIVEGDVLAWALAGVLVVGVGPATAPFRSRAISWTAGLLAAAALIAGTLEVMADHRAAAALAIGQVQLADEASRLRPDSYRYRLLAAEMARREGDLPGAIERADAALALSPYDPALGAAKIRLLVEAAETGGQEELAVAIRALRDLIEVDPNQPDHHQALGVMLARAGDASGAEQAFLMAEFLAPASAVPPLSLAGLYLAAGEYEAAGDALDRAEAIDPGAEGLEDLRRQLEDRTGGT
jgi:O-antigen ligase